MIAKEVTSEIDSRQYKMETECKTRINFRWRQEIYETNKPKKLNDQLDSIE